MPRKAAPPVGRVPQGPRKVPRPPYVQPLEQLVGRWDVSLHWSEATHKLAGGPRDVETEALFDWLPGLPVLRYRLATSTCLIGGDESTGEFHVLYSDERPVARVCRMTFARGVWRIWRDAPGFRQRFEGQLREGGRTIKGFWDKCEDGRTWTRDFDLTFRRSK